VVNTGLAIANPNNQPATLTFFFSNSNGTFGNGSVTIPANGQMARFLNELPFNGQSPLRGTFSFSSTVPIAAIALRGLTNTRSEFIITTLPVAELNPPMTGTAMLFPHFADGGGWTTQIVLVNPTETTLSGAVQFLDEEGHAATVAVNGETDTSFAYSIPARTSQTFQTAGTASAIGVGSVRVTPVANTATPSGLAIFSYR